MPELTFAESARADDAIPLDEFARDDDAAGVAETSFSTLPDAPPITPSIEPGDNISNLRDEVRADALDGAKKDWSMHSTSRLARNTICLPSKFAMINSASARMGKPFTGRLKRE
ncbi:hypothetical protein RRG08_015074 [Elysia crispata]|uniref:Uncharacterized protein n=1 Tax=Elysia crispata TaxID=231223 RepID=A0AAE1B5L8_9GAST|nr:hypothetical protein RRG08_015074 [Elysia crispata]